MEIGIWNLGIVCYLEFVIWNLSLTIASSLPVNRKPSTVNRLQGMAVPRAEYLDISFAICYNRCN